MPGFIGAIGVVKNFIFCNENRKDLVTSFYRTDMYIVERRTINKFINDKIFYEDDSFLIITEGVILNRVYLENKYKVSTFKDCIIEMYKDLGDKFFNSFRGSFSGVFYNKERGSWIIYTDHIGDKQVFYTELNQGILFGSEMSFMHETLILNNIPITLNEAGVYLGLTHGFLIEEHTLVTEIKKLSAGHYLQYCDNQLTEIEYHRFNNKPNLKMTELDAIEGIDKHFRNAVQLQFEKDIEYGYKHLTCLSGGLDSRMTVWVAHQMGYTNQLNTTFSQSNYLDFTIAQQISTDLNHDFLFKTLDHGNFIEDLDKVTELTYGSANFLGLAHGKSLYDLINFKNYGIVHTGMIGDAIIGTFFKKLDYNNEVKIGQGAYSQELIDRLLDYKFRYKYDNEEIFCLYTRAFTGANQGALVFQEYSESISPFCDVDFLEFCYSIPLELRFKHKIYFDWILKKYPNAAKYVWEKNNKNIESFVNKIPKYINVFGRQIPAFYNPEFKLWIIGFLLRRLGLRKKGEKVKIDNAPTQSSMNPISYWYNSDNNFKKFITNYWLENFKSINNKKVYSDMRYLFEECSIFEKLQVLSVLSAVKKINSKN